MYTHFVFNTYSGKHSLIAPKFKYFLSACFAKIAQQYGLKILAFNILADHVHMLIEHPFMPYSKIMKYIKGVSSRKFFIAFPSNRLVDRKLWGRSYHYEKVNEDRIPTVIEYIENQLISGRDKRYV